jgi:hypothetical protein
MIRARWIVALIAVAVAASSYATMPRAARTLAASPTLRAPVRGAIHIHTRRSDGTGTVDDIARAASRAGLNFVILTDHGDGTREPDTPAYRSGVLCIDAVEISTAKWSRRGTRSPRTTYSLGGETRDCRRRHRTPGWNGHRRASLVTEAATALDGMECPD